MNDHNRMKLKRLEQTLKAWLVKKKLDNGTRFYTAQEWIARKESVGNNSLMTLIFEGGLYKLLNQCNDVKLEKEFYEIIESYGFYMEFGYAWSGHFYGKSKEV